MRRLIALVLLLAPMLCFGQEISLNATWLKQNDQWIVRVRPGGRVAISPDSPALTNKNLVEVRDAQSHLPIRFEIVLRGRTLELTLPDLERPISLSLKIRGLILRDGSGRTVAYNEEVDVSGLPAAAGEPTPQPLARTTPSKFYSLAPEPSGGGAPPPSFSGQGAPPPMPIVRTPPTIAAVTDTTPLAHATEPPKRDQHPGAKGSTPQFPFPPPMASAFENVPRELLVGDKTTPLLKDVDLALSAAFESCGYGEKSFYAVPDGFAMASRIEQMNADGTPGDERWSLEVNPIKKFSIDAYLNALFRARPGHYRVIVFIVTNHPFQQTETRVSPEDAGLWVKKGLNELPKEIGEREFSDDYACTALVYEFKRLGSGKASFVEPSEITGRTHLEKSGLMSALQSSHE